MLEAYAILIWEKGGSSYFTKGKSTGCFIPKLLIVKRNVILDLLIKITFPQGLLQQWMTLEMFWLCWWLESKWKQKIEIEAL